MSDLRGRISNLSPEKRELLRRRMGAAQAKRGLPSIVRRAEEGPLPLSFAQQRLWFLDQLMPGSAFYNTSAHLRFGFNLDANALTRALNEIVRRHAVLRTTFQAINGQPVQVISPQLILQLPQINLAALPTEEREAQALLRATAQARQPFNLGRGPLLRAELVQLGDADCLFLLTLHHIVSDGWSMEVFFKELAALYTAFAAGTESSLAELPIQYADFALWQREWLSGEVMQAQLAYWKRQLAGLPPLRLPTDRPRPAVQTYRGATQSVIFPTKLYPPLKALGQRHDATLFMVLLAAFQILLHRYSGQDDFAVGMPIANRTRAEIEGLIGFFINTLVLRVDLRDDPPFSEALRRIRETALAAYAHQDLPFEKLVEELHPERDPGRNPLFQVMFQLQNTSTLAARAWDQRPVVRPLKVERGTTQFDISFDMWESDDGLSGQIEFSTDLFEHQTIESMMRHFEILLWGIANNPDWRISQLPLMSEAERNQVIFAWNATGRDYPRETCAHILLEEQAGKTPEAQAVTSRWESLSYSQLNETANRQARYLMDIGIKRGSIVGVCLPRSVELATAVLAVWKTGAAYLPLDPAYPAERLAWMLDDSRAAALLAQELSPPSLPTHAESLRTFDISEVKEAMAHYSGSDLPSTGASSDLAYIIYTSGSTGRPKGVPVTHRALVNHALAIAQEFGLNSADRVLQFASPSFDVAAEEMFPTWLSGGTLVLHEAEALAPEEFLVELDETAVTVVNLPATYWGEWLIAMVTADSALPSGLRLVVIGSERVPPERVALWQRHYGTRVPLINAYGVTEATITALLYRVPSGPLLDPLPAEIPIGRPIANVQAYVLDRHRQPCPVGVAGELYLGGDGLSRGYLSHPELTREKFVPDPFGYTPDGRLYRTGDRARFLADGNLEFLGRLDQQTKIRGYRIEPDEIESVLNGIPGVSQAAVIAREDSADERRLVGYVVPDRTGRRTTSGEADGEQVNSWRVLYDEIYGQAPSSSDATFNTVGWNSTYNGLPIPPNEMCEWTETTVSRILALQPRRVLEIGCGTGLLLFRIGPQCQSYVATDFSPVALRNVATGLAVQPCPQVRLLECHADDFTNLEGESFDTILLNSIVQYFPSVDYLLRVLAGARRLLAPGGAIFVGDVRSLPLLSAYHTSLELYRAPSELPGAQLLQRVIKGVAQEQELVLDPALFRAVGRRLPEMDSVTVEIKEGRGGNELMKFRYDVVLRAARTAAYPSTQERGSGSQAFTSQRPGQREMQREILVWDAAGMTVEYLDHMLTEQSPLSLWLQRIPNARVQPAVTALSWLNTHTSMGTTGELRTELAELCTRGIEPDDLREVARKLDYSAVITWSDSGPDGRYDVQLDKNCGGVEISPLQKKNKAEAWKALDLAGIPIPSPHPSRAEFSTGELRHYANNPTQGAYEKRLVPGLRNSLKELLPAYMVPAVFVLLDTLPLLPNGKVDRASLPSPDAPRPETAQTFILPRNLVEGTLARIWADLLGLEQVGIHDNFFELGGDSILTIQIISRANKAGLRLTPKHLFQHQTIAELAALSGITTKIPDSTSAQSGDIRVQSEFSQNELDRVIRELARSQEGLS